MRTDKFLKMLLLVSSSARRGDVDAEVDGDFVGVERVVPN